MVVFAESQNKKEQSPPSSNYRPLQMADSDFHKIRELIYKEVGIEIKPHKKHLVINRLAKRLRHLGLSDFSAYIEYLKSSDKAKQEFTEMVDALTTNKTDFFREAKHFDFLRDVAIPSIRKQTNPNRIKVWSAACSSGEEPYTLSICLHEMAARDHSLRFDILATDVSETILRSAVDGIYTQDKIQPIPMELLRKYFLRGNGRFKVKPDLAKPITFKKNNLKHDFHRALGKQHIIFLRNVMIYFDRPTQEEIIKKCWHVLEPGGYLFLGLSETLHGSSVPFEYAAPSVYRKIKP